MVIVVAALVGVIVGTAIGVVATINLVAYGAAREIARWGVTGQYNVAVRKRRAFAPLEKITGFDSDDDASPGSI